jgi:hypothetical protein
LITPETTPPSIPTTRPTGPNAIIFGWFAQESMLAAELANNQTQRELWLRLALMWAPAARQSRDEGATPPETDYR